MKKFILILSVVGLTALIVWFTWYLTPSGKVPLKGEGFEFATAEQYATLDASKPLPKNAWNPKAISVCKAALVSAGVVVKQPDLRLQTVLETDDKKSALYFFGVRRISGPTFVLRVDNNSLHILEQFSLPDA